MKEVFNQKSPIILGVDVERGVLKPGTPLCVIERDCIKIGVVESIQQNHKVLKEARKITGSVGIKITEEPGITMGRHFMSSDGLVSLLSRESIDALKNFFKDEMTDEDWNFVRELKPVFHID